MGADDLLRLKRNNPAAYRAALADTEAKLLGGTSARPATDGDATGPSGPAPMAYRGRSLEALVDHFRRAGLTGDDAVDGLAYAKKSNAVYACARLRATNLSRLPLKGYRFGTGGRGTGKRIDVRDPLRRLGMPTTARGRRIAEAGDVVEVEASPVLERLNRPNDDWTGRQMIYATEFALCLEGEGKWLAERGAGAKGIPTELAYVLPSRLAVVKASADDMFRSIAGWTLDRNSASRRDLTPGEVLWFRYVDPADPDYGVLSPLSVARLAADAYTAAMKSNRDLFKRGLAAAGMVVPPEEMTFDDDAQRHELERDISRMLMGDENRHALAVMPYRFDVRSFGISPKDAEFTALMDYAIEDVGRAYGVPIEFIGGSRRTYQNLGEAQSSLWTNTLEPEAVFLAEELTGKLLPMFGADGAGVDFLAFDLSDIAALQDDEGARWAIQKEQLSAGALGVNEWRADNGLEALPNAPLLIGQLNGIILALQSLGMGTLTQEQAIGVISVGVGLGDDVAAKLVGNPPPRPAPLPADDGTDAPPAAAPAQAAAPVPTTVRDATDDAPPPRVPPLEFGSDEHARWWGERVKVAEARKGDAEAVVRRLFARQRDSLAMSLEDASRAATDAHARMSIADVAALFDRRRWLREFREAIRGPIGKAAADGAAGVAGDVAGAAYDPSASQAVNFLRRRAQRFAVEVNDTTWARLKARLEDAMGEGKVGRELAAVVRDTYAGWSGRAEVIARTEVIGAYNGGGLLYAQQTGLDLDKEWVTALDERVRETHQAAHGQRVRLDEDFEVGGASGPAPGELNDVGEVVNCRCVCRYLPRDRSIRSISSEHIIPARR